MPPNRASHAESLCSLKPGLRHKTLTFNTTSTSVKNPMICASVNRFFVVQFMS